jgi:hypothetical protein
VDPLTLEGVCTPMCHGTVEDPVCEGPDTLCVAANEGAIFLCLPQCDPLGQDCAADELCIAEPDGTGWFCAPGITTPAGDGEPCEYLNVCTVGAVCTSAAAVTGCAGSWACCAALCDLAGEACANPETECAAWYEPGAAPAGLDDVGICAGVPEAPEDGWLHPLLVNMVADRGD